ncbi:protein misato homolog 1-like [Daphnia pulex]|uniref:protein misato homolog 1-like n=1 Tax=Daphnia pulex TaxID=6669 RepID=UPI001EDED800|nr:protein misato homolog 1-like [Daphnia pulex]
MAKEILTIQLGEFSNVIGAHWWNIQSAAAAVSSDKYEAVENEIDHSVFFREGVSDKAVGNPRLVAVTIKGEIDFPNRKVEFPSTHQNEHDWILREDTASCDNESYPNMDFESNDFCDWRALLNNKLHPKSINNLNGFQHMKPTETFNLFSQGISCMKKEDDLEYIENQIRFFIEECDYFQGFNILLDADNGYGGVTSQLLELINQEYSNKVIYTIPSFPAHSEYNFARRAECLANMGLVIDSLFEGSSMLSPVSLDPLWCSTNSRKFRRLEDLKPYSMYHAGAIIATALDSILLPLQTKKSFFHMTDFVKKITMEGRKAVGVSCAIPLLDKVSNFDSINSAFLEVVPLTPGVENFRNCWRQHLVWRGLSNPCEFQSVVDCWSRRQWDHTMTVNSVFSTFCSAVKPYPEKFLGSSGPYETGHSHFRTFGGLHSSETLGHSLRELHSAISKIEIKSLQRFFSSGMEEDDFLENRDHIFSYAELYDEN